MNIEERIKKVYEALNKTSVFADVYQFESLPVLCLEINLGDWKHEHGLADCLMSELGYHKLCEDVTEEDGSDTYSSIHYYAFN